MDTCIGCGSEDQVPMAAAEVESSPIPCNQPEDLPEELASTPPTPTITFSVCDDDDEILEHPDALLDDPPAPGNPSADEASGKRRDSLFVFPSFQQLRRMSDSSMKQLKNKLHRMSTSGSTASWFLRSAGHNNVLPRNSRAGSVHVDAQPRKMSVDIGGILKQANSPPKCVDEVVHHHRGFFKLTDGGLSRKSVSFSIRDNVRLFDRWENEDDDGEEDEEDLSNLTIAPDSDSNDDSSRGRSLVPTFVFPGKRPTYAKDFQKNVIILESVDVTDDLCIMGNIRVNMSKLRALQAVVKNHRSTGRVSVGATYSTDGWKTERDTRAMVVNAQPHQALKGTETRAMRFYIDCDDLEIGDVVEFWLWCCDKFYPIVGGASAVAAAAMLGKAGRARGARGAHRFIDTGCPPLIKKYKDDNDGLMYKVSCTPKLNVWGAKAAQELKNLTPIMKYNKNYI